MSTRYLIIAAGVLLSCSLTAYAQQNHRSDVESSKSVVVSRLSDSIADNRPKALVRHTSNIHTLISLDFGYTHRIGKADQGIDKKLADKMRKGFTYSLGVVHFFNENVGFGAMVNGKSYTRVMLNTVNGSLSSRGHIYYLAPQFNYRFFDRKGRNALVLGLSAGPAMLRYNFKSGADETYDMELSTDNSYWGFNTTTHIGYDIRISGKSFLGFKVTCSAGSVSIPDSGKEGISSLDFTIGFRL